MSREIKLHCDGQGCKNNIELQSVNDIDDVLKTFGWSIDSINEFHYCSSCVKKMIKSGELIKGAE